MTLFNHPEVGQRLFSLPYPCAPYPGVSDRRMDRAFAEKMESEVLAKQAPLLAQLRASPLREGGAAAAAVWPFKALWSASEARAVGDIFLWPNTVEPLWDGARTEQHRRAQKGNGANGAPTEASVLALAPAQQSWMLGYVLEPAQYGRGVMSEALGCILEGWVRRVMRVGEVAAFIEVDNPGSVGVAVRNGFVWRREERSQWPEEKGGDVHVNGYYTRDMRP